MIPVVEIPCDTPVLWWEPLANGNLRIWCTHIQQKPHVRKNFVYRFPASFASKDKHFWALSVAFCHRRREFESPCRIYPLTPKKILGNYFSGWLRRFRVINYVKEFSENCFLGGYVNPEIAKLNPPPTPPNPLAARPLYRQKKAPWKAFQQKRLVLSKSCRRAGGRACRLRGNRAPTKVPG